MKATTNQMYYQMENNSFTDLVHFHLKSLSKLKAPTHMINLLMNILSKDILSLKTSQKFSSVLEPYAVKVASTVLRRECHCEVMFLSDKVVIVLNLIVHTFKMNKTLILMNLKILTNQISKVLQMLQDLMKLQKQKNFLVLLQFLQKKR